MDDRSKALAAYARLRRDLGRPPSSREFSKVYAKRQLSALFQGGRAFSQLQEVAGDSPRPFSSPKSSLPDVLLRWGKLAQETLGKFGRLPIQDDWARSGQRPSVSGIKKSHGVKWTEIPVRFAKQCADQDDWREVVLAIDQRSPSPKSTQAPDGETCFVYLMRDLRNGAYKIGISASPSSRERTLQSEQPKTQLVASKKYVNRKMALAIEKALHDVYSHKKKRGEWFDLGEQDVQELCATLDDKVG
jgi:predicted GIY-YIG superfamily endonuclease